MKDEKPRIVICVKGGLVAEVLSNVPGIEVMVMDWDVFDVVSDEERRDYLTKYPHVLF